MITVWQMPLYFISISNSFCRTSSSQIGRSLNPACGWSVTQATERIRSGIGFRRLSVPRIMKLLGLKHTEGGGQDKLVNDLFIY